MNEADEPAEELEEDLEDDLVDESGAGEDGQDQSDELMGDQGAADSQGGAKSADVVILDDDEDGECDPMPEKPACPPPTSVDPKEELRARMEYLKKLCQQLFQQTLMQTFPGLFECFKKYS